MIQFLSKVNPQKIQRKTCLLRVDLNIEKGEEGENFRFLSIFPTVNFLLKNKVKILIISHRGRFYFKKYTRLPDFSLKIFASLISKKIKIPVKFIEETDFQKIKKIIEKSKEKVFLLENLRFFPEEENNNYQFAKKLASLADFYVNDAFSVSHRKNASVVAITKYLPAYGGFLLEKEIKNLNKIVKNKSKSLIVIIGGAKISDKIEIIKNLWRKTKFFLIGGAIASNFFLAKGLPIPPKSLVDQKEIKNIKKYLDSKKIVLPIDLKIKNNQILDIGQETVKKYSQIIKKAKLIIWSGPLGFFEKKGFEKGTEGIWQAIFENKKAKIVVGGGETLSSLENFLEKNKKLKIKDNFFISTGGGAMFEFLSNKKLPGIKALNQKSKNK